VSIPLVSQQFHLRVLDIASAKPKHGEKHTGLSFALDQTKQLAITGDADVEITVGRENHSIVGRRDEAVSGDLVGELDPGAASRRTARLELVDRRADRFLIAPRSRRQHKTG